jgi:hypothetical protein
MILVPGPGPNKAGQWSRTACVKENLLIGSMLPYIDACKRSGWGCLIMNPNANIDPETQLTILNSETPDMHVWNVWKDYIVPS